MASLTKIFAPGDYIRDELEARGWAQEDLAEIIRRPIKSVNQIIAGKKQITPQTAHELAAAFGTSAELWMNLESAYRLAKESSEQGDVERRAGLYQQGPVREMVRRNWIQSADKISILEKYLAAFFEGPCLATAARKSTSYSTTTPAQRAWLCRAFKLAERVSAKPYSVQHARELLPNLHALTVSEQEIRKVPAVLSEMGIRFVVVEHLQHTKLDGAAMWLSPTKPVVVLSLRFDRIDGFWHTLCHEISHVLHGDCWSIDDDLISSDRIGTGDQSEEERRADDEASNFLVKRETLDSFIARNKPRFSKTNIVRFANLHQIHPGIVVGQLQHRKAIKYSHSREMLVPVRQLITDIALTDGWGHLPPS